MRIFFLYYIYDIEDMPDDDLRSELYFNQLDRPFIMASEEEAAAVVKKLYAQDYEEALEELCDNDDEKLEFSLAVKSEPEFFNRLEEVPGAARHLDMFDERLQKNVIWYSPGVHGLRVLFQHDVGQDARDLTKESQA